MIKFGTDGWQGVISEDFTFDNVRKVARAVAVYLINHRLIQNPLIVGYDARFLAERFAGEVVKVMEGAGCFVYFVERDTPTPVIDWEVKDKEAAGAIMITAASSQPQYCGLKFLCAADCAKEIQTYLYLEGAKTTTAVSNQVLLNYQSAMGLIGAGQKAKSKEERFEPCERYLKHLEGLVDASVIKKAKLKVVVDPMYGSGRGYLDMVLQRLGCQVEEIHNYRDVLFGGKSPDPTEENLAELKAKVLETRADLGVALNGDASLFALIDREGKYRAGEAGKDAILESLLKVEALARKGNVL
jgi:phosphomannomutase